KELIDLQDEYNHFKQNAAEQLSQHKGWLTEHQRTIAELRESSENKQRHISQLEAKTRDLNYELKTLLRLAEKPIETVQEKFPLPTADINKDFTSALREDSTQIFDFAVRTQEEAHVHLKRILDVAQRITGTSPFGSSRFRDLQLDNYALDLRS